MLGKDPKAEGLKLPDPVAASLFSLCDFFQPHPLTNDHS